MLRSIAFALAAFAFASGAAIADEPSLPTQEGDYVIHNFKFQSGETLADLRMHYTTLGTPQRDAQGRVTNAVLIMHGTGGDGHQFIRPIFSGVLFVPGGLLDIAKYFIILPDDIGHGKSSKPSDGLHARFPHYDYADMVAAEHALVSDGLHVNHLRLVMGTSMGCMHSFMWGEAYPDFMDALMPLACEPTQIAGRNRMWRKMLMDGIRNDPAWMGGEYKQQPQMGLRIAIDMLILAGSAPHQMQKEYPTQASADAFLDDYTTKHLASLDANDLLYQVDSSRDGIAENLAKQIPHVRYVVIPVSDQTYGHGTHTRAAVWQSYMAELLKESAPH
jgi:homoserine O-acetyltransferase